MKIAAKFFMLALFIGMGLTVVLTHGRAGAAFKQFPKPHPNCSLDAVFQLSNGVSGASKGNMEMEIIGESQDGEAASQTLRPVSFSSSGDDPVMGHLEWKLDASRDVESSTITANTADDLYPATCDIFFYVDAVATSSDGVATTYRSMKPVHMRSENLMSFNPHINEKYDVVDPVDFAILNDDGSMGEVSFTVTSLSSILN